MRIHHLLRATSSGLVLLVASVLAGCMQTDGVVSRQAEEKVKATFEKTLGAGAVKTKPVSHRPKTLPILRGFSSRVVALAFSPDGELLAGAYSDPVVVLWDTQTWTIRHKLQSRDNPMTDTNSMAFSADGKFIAVANGLYLRIWSTSTGQVVRTLQSFADLRASLVWKVVWSPDGRILAVVSDPNKITLWRASDWQPMKTRIETREPISSLSFSPDSSKRQIVPTSKDRPTALTV